MKATRTYLFMMVGVLALAPAACGSGDGAATPAPDVEQVSSCLEAGGMTTTTDSVIPAETREKLGIEASLSLAGEGDLVGLGSITWYVDADTAAEAHEAGAAVRTEDVARAVQGTVAWDFAGGDDAVLLIEDCLAPDA